MAVPAMWGLRLVGVLEGGLRFLPVWDGIEGMSDAYGLSMFFYFMLMVLHDAQQVRDPTHMRTISPLSHLTLWCLHTFTLTILLAAHLSNHLLFSLHLTATLPPSTYLHLVAVLVEALLPSWRMHPTLLIVGMSWTCAVGFGALGVLRATGVGGCGSWGGDMTIVGAAVILVSFGIVWGLEGGRDKVAAMLGVKVDEEEVWTEQKKKCDGDEEELVEGEEEAEEEMEDRFFCDKGYSGGAKEGERVSLLQGEMV
ncbi:hypothetical protein HK101_005357 [Irineochytrium annulatum]|nr:hypothetical protein HK101_005357 [Irineochytrium annulatum]